MKTLIMMVGLPRSGKTTKALELSDAYQAPIVSPDNIRLALHGERYIQLAEPFVWAVAHVMVRALFCTHDFVILDACNNTKKRRAEWRSISWQREYEIIDTPVEVCCERARQAADTDMVEVIERMFLASERVADDESD